MNGFMYHMSDFIGTIVMAPKGGSGVNSETGSGIADALRAFVGPILLIVIGIVAVTFLFKRQLTQFFQFMALAILVALLFYTPNVLPAIANWIASLFTATPGTDVTPPT